MVMIKKSFEPTLIFPEFQTSELPVEGTSHFKFVRCSESILCCKYHFCCAIFLYPSGVIHRKWTPEAIYVCVKLQFMNAGNQLLDYLASTVIWETWKRLALCFDIRQIFIFKESTYLWTLYAFLKNPLKSIDLKKITCHDYKLFFFWISKKKKWYAYKVIF